MRVSISMRFSAGSSSRMPQIHSRLPPVVRDQLPKPRKMDVLGTGPCSLGTQSLLSDQVCVDSTGQVQVFRQSLARLKRRHYEYASLARIRKAEIQKR